MLTERINRVFDCRDGMLYHPSNRRIQDVVFGTPQSVSGIGSAGKPRDAGTLVYGEKALIHNWKLEKRSLIKEPDCCSHCGRYMRTRYSRTMTVYLSGRGPCHYDSLRTSLILAVPQ